MDCVTVRENMHDFAAGLIDPSVKRDISRHIRRCPECRALLEETTAYYAAIRRSGQVQPPSDFIQQTMARIQRPRRLWREVAAIFFLPWKIKVPLEALGIVLISVVIFAVYRPYRTLEMAPDAVTLRETTVEDVKNNRRPRKQIQKITIARIDTVSDTAPATISSEKMERLRDLDDSLAQSADSESIGAASGLASSKITVALTIYHPSRKEEAPAEEYRAVATDRSSVKLGSSFGGAQPALEKQAEIHSSLDKMKEVIAKYSGKIVTSSHGSGKDTLMIELPRNNYSALIKELGGLGKMQEKKNKQPGAPDRIIIDMLMK